MKLSKQVWILISGISWLLIGFLLLKKGIYFILNSIQESSQTPLIDGLSCILKGGRYQIGLCLICIGLFLGLIKNRLILSKTANRISDRVKTSFNHRLSLNEVYDRKYYTILCLMIGFGIAFRWFSLPSDIRGIIDVAIGSALIQGSLLYFRQVVTGYLKT